MIPLLDRPNALDECAKEIGCAVGQLLTPLTFAKLNSSVWAIDNGGFTKFNESDYVKLLDREEYHKDECLFVTVPDVVGSARRTLEIFDIWAPRLAGWKLALACQDGQENLPIPWEKISAVFIGGTTEWKMSGHAAQIVKAAKILGKHAHIGRVNTPDRWKHFEAMNADTADGTGITIYSHMRVDIANRNNKKGFFSGGV